MWLWDSLVSVSSARIKQAILISQNILRNLVWLYKRNSVRICPSKLCIDVCSLHQGRETQNGEEVNTERKLHFRWYQRHCASSDASITWISDWQPTIHKTRITALCFYVSATQSTCSLQLSENVITSTFVWNCHKQHKDYWVMDKIWVLWCHADLDIFELIPESIWTFVTSLKKFPQDIPEILCSKECDNVIKQFNNAVQTFNEGIL